MSALIVSMSMLCVENEDGYLFSQAIYPTKIKAEDLPEWYMYGRYYKCFGYLSAKGVVDMKYVPSRYSNHFLKDDFLFISYNSMISENPEANSVIDMYTSYDERINANEILDFLKAAKRHSEYDLSLIHICPGSSCGIAWYGTAWPRIIQAICPRCCNGTPPG